MKAQEKADNLDKNSHRKAIDVDDYYGASQNTI